MKKFTLLVLLSCLFFSASIYADLFFITNTEPAPAQIGTSIGNIGTAVFRIQNTSRNVLRGNGVVGLPAGVTQVLADGYCAHRFDLAPAQSCLLKLQINGAQVQGKIVGTPKTPMICNVPDRLLYCYYPEKNQSLYSEVVPASQLAEISVSPAADVNNPYVFTPGETFTWTFTNAGSRYTAYQIRAEYSPSMAQYITTTTNTCAAVPPGGTCVISAAISSSAPALDSQYIVFSGANTNQIDASAVIVYGQALVPGTLNFSTPGTATLVVTNVSNKDVYITGATLSASLVHVTLDPTNFPLLCPKNGTCTLSYTAASNAYGTGYITINYLQSGVPFSVDASAGVAQASIEFLCGDISNPVSCNGIIGLANNIADQIVQIKNTGNFYWQGIEIDYLNPVNTINLNTSACSSLSAGLAPGAACSLSFTTANPSVPITSSLSVSGINLTAVNVAIAVAANISIMPADQSNQYFSYQSILVYNNTTGTINLLTPQLSANLDLTSYCTGVCTPPTSTYASCGSSIASGSSCLIWFNTQQSSAEPLSTQSGTATIKLEYLGQTYTSVFSIQQQTALYVTGDFTSVGSGVSASQIAKWDGVNWYPLGAGLTGGRGRAFKLYQGNLYVAGEFDSAGTLLPAYSKLIALWNGTQWQNIPGGTLNQNAGAGNAYALLVGSSDNQLYVGGTFQTAGTLSTNNIAKWSAATGLWSALASATQQTNGFNGVTSTVYALSELGSTIYLSGAFGASTASSVATGRVTMPRIGTWTPASSTWSSLGGAGVGLSANTHSLLVQGTSVYAGGNFLTTTTSTPVLNHVGLWNGTAWSALSSGLGTVAGENVYALLNYSQNGLFYAGGSFTGFNYLAAWNGSSWSTANSGLNNTVRSLLEQNGILYVGGEFSSYNYLAAYDGSAWSTVGGGANARTYTIWAGSSLLLG